MSIREYIQNPPQGTLGLTSASIGGGGTAMQMTDWLQQFDIWVQLFIKYGNVVLLAGGLYLMVKSILNKDKRRNRRKEDS